jgi:hypothetical protein
MMIVVITILLLSTTVAISAPDTTANNTVAVQGSSVPVTPEPEDASDEPVSPACWFGHENGTLYVIGHINQHPRNNAPKPIRKMKPSRGFRHFVVPGGKN